VTLSLRAVFSPQQPVDMKSLAMVVLCALLCTPVKSSIAQQTSDVSQGIREELASQESHVGGAADIVSARRHDGRCEESESSPSSDGDEDGGFGAWVFDWGCWTPDSPGYYLQAEAPILLRSTIGSRASNQPLVINTITNATLLSTDQFDNAGVQAGFRLLLGHQSSDGQAWEASFLRIDDWRSSARVVGNSDLAIPGDLGLATLDFFNADTMQVSLATQLDSFEIDYLRSFDIISLLGGFRYLNVSEQLEITPSDSVTAGGQYRISTGNNLFGAQIGARMGRQVGRLSWSITGKAGMFDNEVRQRQYVEDFPAFILRNTQTNSAQLAFVGDMNFSAGYRLNDVWSIRAGYNLMWIDGVALAAQQVDFTNTATSGTNVITKSGLFLHGVNVGLEARW
jgi:hypothetical protein